LYDPSFLCLEGGAPRIVPLDNLVEGALQSNGIQRTQHPQIDALVIQGRDLWNFQLATIELFLGCGERGGTSRVAADRPIFTRASSPQIPV
jgi:hypothetical protein